MRHFKCFDCNYTWQLPHGEGGRGCEQTCPECGSENVHRTNKDGERKHNCQDEAHEMRKKHKYTSDG